MLCWYVGYAQYHRTIIRGPYYPTLSASSHSLADSFGLGQDSTDMVPENESLTKGTLNGYSPDSLYCHHSVIRSLQD